MLEKQNRNDPGIQHSGASISTLECLTINCHITDKIISDFSHTSGSLPQQSNYFLSNTDFGT